MRTCIIENIECTLDSVGSKVFLIRRGSNPMDSNVHVTNWYDCIQRIWPMIFYWNKNIDGSSTV
jgi:hypothetical protein